MWVCTPPKNPPLTDLWLPSNIILQERGRARRLSPDVTCSCKQSPSIVVIFTVGLTCSLSLIPPWFSFTAKPLRAIVIPEGGERERPARHMIFRSPLEYLYIFVDDVTVHERPVALLIPVICRAVKPGHLLNNFMFYYTLWVLLFNREMELK